MDENKENVGYEYFFLLLKLISAINITKIMHAAMSKHYCAYEGLRSTTKHFCHIIFHLYPMYYFLNAH